MKGIIGVAGLLLAELTASLGNQTNPDMLRERYRNNKGIPRSRTPGPRRPAGTKIAKMAEEGRIGIRR